jgi:membrane associated rhomboid family serine protease
MGSMNVTTILIAITALISYYAWQNPHKLMRWMLNPYEVQRRNQYDRFITSGFIHNDLAHLLFNMLTLYFFGGVVEAYFTQIFGGTEGIVLYVLLYLVAIVAADIPTFFKHRNQPYYNSLGASGGVSAIVFSGIVFQPTQGICLYFVLCLPGFVLGGLYLAYSMYKSRQPDAANINHSAHFYGAVFGFAATIVLIPRALPVFFEQLAGKLTEWIGMLGF